jgi:hypothetical protein
MTEDIIKPIPGDSDVVKPSLTPNDIRMMKSGSPRPKLPKPPERELSGNHTIIIAPHGDDEIIGCYEVLIKERVIIVYVGNLDDKRKVETKNLCEHFDIKAQYYTRQIPPQLLSRENKFYFPDPIYEIHPNHRLEGMVGESFARSGFDVIFYSTNMNAPYIHEVPVPSEKEKTLNSCYPSQKSLWESEKKYILFEGYCKWIF